MDVQLENNKKVRITSEHEQDDRISRLPDEPKLLHKILSCFAIKLVVQTWVLLQ